MKILAIILFIVGAVINKKNIIKEFKNNNYDDFIIN